MPTVSLKTASTSMDSDGKVGEKPRRAAHTPDLKRSSEFRTTRQPKLRLRARLTEGDLLVNFDYLGKALGICLDLCPGPAVAPEPLLSASFLSGAM